MARFQPSLPRSSKSDWQLDFERFRANCKQWLQDHALEGEEELVLFVEGGELYRDRTWVCALKTRESYFAPEESVIDNFIRERQNLGAETRFGSRGHAAVALRFLLEGREAVLLRTEGDTPYPLRRCLASELLRLEAEPWETWHADTDRPSLAFRVTNRARVRAWRLVAPLFNWLESPWDSLEASWQRQTEIAYVNRDGGRASLGDWLKCFVDEQGRPLLEDGDCQLITSCEEVPGEVKTIWRRFRCNGCASVCDAGEWLESWGDDLCSFCGSQDIEGVPLATSLAPPRAKVVL